MRRCLVVLLLAVIPLASPSAAPDDLLYTRFERYLDALRAQTGIPGMVALVAGETDIVWERTFGRQDQDRALPMRMDTPFHIDGLSQVLTSVLTLQCAEWGTLSVDDALGVYDSGSPEPATTIRQVLTHTRQATVGGLLYSYEPARYDALQKVVRECSDDSYRENVANLFDRLAMRDSVPGVDAPDLVPPAEGIPTLEAADRYRGVLTRLTTSYVVQGRWAIPSPHPSTTLTASSGVVSTARDLAQLDIALKQGLLLPETLAAAWSLPAVEGQAVMPHGLGWFVQNRDGELVVWQYGVSPVSSSFMMSLPQRRLTMILLANSSGLVEPFVLSPGDVNASPFARVFFALVSP